MFGCFKQRIQFTNFSRVEHHFPIKTFEQSLKHGKVVEKYDWKKKFSIKFPSPATRTTFTEQQWRSIILLKHFSSKRLLNNAKLNQFVYSPTMVINFYCITMMKTQNCRPTLQQTCVENSLLYFSHDCAFPTWAQAFFRSK